MHPGTERPRRGAARAYPELDAVREAAERARSIWSAAPCATFCSVAAAPTSTSSSWATPPRSPPRLGAEVVEHERFAHRQGAASTATRSTSPPPAPRPIPQPGALPVVEPAAGLEADLARRDFTINAMAIPLRGEPRADRPPRRRGPTSTPGCCASSIPAPSWTTRRGRCAPPATRRASASSWSRRPQELLRAADLEHGLGRSPRGRAAAAGRRAGRRRRLRPARRVGAGRAARGRGRAGRRGGGAARSGRPGADVAPREQRGARRGAGAARGTRRRWPPSSPERPSEARRAGGRARPGRAGPGPGAGRRVARSVPARVARRRPRDRRRGPDRRRGRRRDPRSAGASSEALRRKLDGEIAGRERGAGGGAGGGEERTMEWREGTGSRWLRGDAAGRDGGLLDPGRRGQRAAFDGLNLGVLTEDEREAVVENRRRLAPRSASPPSGSRSAARCTAPSWRSTPARRCRARSRGRARRDRRGRRPRHRRGRPGGARLRRRLPAGRARGPRWGGDAPLRLARPGGGDRRPRGRGG